MEQLGPALGAVDEKSAAPITDPEDPRFVLPPAPLPPSQPSPIPRLDAATLRNRNPELARAKHRRGAAVDLYTGLYDDDKAPVASIDRMSESLMTAGRAGTILQIGHAQDPHIAATTNTVRQQLSENAQYRGLLPDVAVHNIPDKWGGRGLEGDAKSAGDREGTYGVPDVTPAKAHGPRRSFEPDEKTRYLSDMSAGESLDIVTHGSLDGKMGGYSPPKLARLLGNLGGDEKLGDVNLDACMSTYTGNASGTQLSGARTSPALGLERSLAAAGIETTVGGYNGLLYGGTHERPPEFEFADLKVDKVQAQLDASESRDQKANRPFPSTRSNELTSAVSAATIARDAIPKVPAKLIRPGEDEM